MKLFAFVSLLLLSAALRESFDQLRHHWDYDERAPLDIKQRGLEMRDG